MSKSVFVVVRTTRDEEPKIWAACTTQIDAELFIKARGSGYEKVALGGISNQRLVGRWFSRTYNEFVDILKIPLKEITEDEPERRADVV